MATLRPSTSNTLKSHVRGRSLTFNKDGPATPANRRRGSLVILQDEASPLPSMEDANAIEPLYDLLEKDSEGVLQTETLARFFEEISDKTLSLAHTKRAVNKICSGNGGIVLKRNFVAVLVEMSNRMKRAERIRWDLKLFDTDGVGSIPTDQCRVVFQAIQGRKFSREKFDEWMKNRRFPDSNRVSIEEIELSLADG